jgi:hypothetical protein
LANCWHLERNERKISKLILHHGHEMSMSIFFVSAHKGMLLCISGEGKFNQMLAEFFTSSRKSFLLVCVCAFDKKIEFFTHTHKIKLGEREGKYE